MQLADIFLGLGQPSFEQLLRTVSLGKLKTYQLFERMKMRLHVTKLNTETLRKVGPRCWERLSQPDSDDFTSELAQAILVSHLDMIKTVLDHLGIPHEDGFFAKDLDAGQYLTPGWQQRVMDRFKDAYPESVLLFYVNHLGLEFGGALEFFRPQPVAAS